MTLYNNQKPDAAILSVEISQRDECSIGVFYLRSEQQLAPVRQWMEEQGMSIVAQTQSDGHPVLMARASKDPEEVLGTLATHGDQFVKPEPKSKAFDPWVWRGITSIVGQSLTLTSGFKRKSALEDRAALVGFAGFNLMANAANIIFGSQKKEDPHQLRVLEESFNEKYKDQLLEGRVPPAPQERHQDLYKDIDQAETFGQKVYAFGKKYSVSGGEIGLRLVGATSLVFPFTPKSRWKNAAGKLRDGSVGEAFDSIKNSNPVTYKSGLVTLLGKAISLSSKEPDPYNPKSGGLISTIREKVTFPLSSVVEGVGAFWMARDSWNTKIKMFGKEHPHDYFGTVGNTVFICGYLIRLAAPYGSLEVNMKELNAHLTDMADKMPREKLPQVLAEMSVDLKKHFKDKLPDTSEIYTQLAEEMKLHHHVDIFDLPAKAQSTVSDSPQKIFASEDLKKGKSVDQAARPASHGERVQLSSEPALGIIH